MRELTGIEKEQAKQRLVKIIDGESPPGVRILVRATTVEDEALSAVEAKSRQLEWILRDPALLKSFMEEGK